MRFDFLCTLKYNINKFIINQLMIRGII